MDAFESLVADLLEADGYWVQRSYKVPLTKEDKVRIGRPSSPRWEVDVVAYRSPANEVLAVECKSYINSRGVSLADLQADSESRRYKLFNGPDTWRVVADRLAADLVQRGLCPSLPNVILCLATGNIRPGDTAGLRQHFEAKGWRLLDAEWIRQKVKDLAARGYDNSVATMVAKLLLRAKV